MRSPFDPPRRALRVLALPLLLAFAPALARAQLGCSSPGGPHRIRGLLVDSTATLTIEPGAVVCGERGGYGSGVIRFIKGGRIVARGTAAAPILFSTSDPAYGWIGLEIYDESPSDTSWVTHALFEHATSYMGAINATDQGTLIVEDVRVRQSYAGVYAHWDIRGRVVRTVVDTTLWSTNSAMTLLGDSMTVEDFTIRAATGVGLTAGQGTTLRGGRILDGRRLGLEVRYDGLHDAAHLIGAPPIRVTGNDQSVSMPIQHFARLYGTVQAQDSLLGNRSDTAYVRGVLLAGTVVARREVPMRLWEVEVASTAVLAAQPGSLFLMRERD
jgi:hypothetical protein